MDGTIIDGAAGNSAATQISSCNALLDEQVDAFGRLKFALERQTALREAADRALARMREEHEDAFEHLLVRCRTLEGEKARGVKSEAASQERLAGLERHLAQREREAAREKQLLIAEHDRLTAERDAVLARNRDLMIVAEREAVLTQDLAKAEERSRVDALQLAIRTKEFDSALAQAAERSRVDALQLAIRAKEVEHALAQAAGERAGREAAESRFAAVIASASWKLGHPLRVLSRALRRALRPGA